MPTGVYTRTEEHRRILGLAHKDKKLTDKARANISKALMGHVISEATKDKIRKANSGINAPWYGKHHSEDTKRKIAEAQTGPKNHLWKGDKVKYKPLHKWVRRYKPKPEFCEECKVNPPIEISNISGEYKRDLTDYRWLCIKCHRKIDFACRDFNPKRYPDW
jgi:hypothetical protein